MEPAGFDRELLGMHAGEEKSFILGWPAESQSIYAGKEAQFHVKLNSVQGYEKPALDDALAQLVGPDYTTQSTICDSRSARAYRRMNRIAPAAAMSTRCSTR
jgi:FKBP-type peptidyl-prolyl cis-trans isomerase (trigger factor)